MEATVVLEGVQELRYADAVLECGAGDVWFAAPGEVHGYRTKAGVACICLAFGPYFLADSMLADRHWLSIFAQPPELRPRVKLAQQRSNVLATGWQIYREAAAQRPGWEAAIRIHLLQVLVTLTRDWLPDQQPASASGHLAALLPALEVVCSRAKLGERVGTLEAARACAMSRSHFCRTFRKSMGRSFGQFEVQSRLAVAARLLTDTQLSIRDVAIHSGFWDASHLDHHFVAHYGTRPRAFRAASGRSLQTR
jgi:AraC-like DNA-binding protein